MPKYNPEALIDNIKRMESNIQAFLDKISTLRKQKAAHRESIKTIDANIEGFLDGIKKMENEKHELELLLLKVQTRTE